MLKKSSIIMLLIGILFTSIPIKAYAVDYYRSILDISGDAYLVFGDDTHPKEDAFDMGIYVDESSINHMSLFIDFDIDDDVIKSRNITKFYVLANDRIIETVYPQYIEDITGDGQPDFRSFYHIAPTSMELVGTDVRFQIVAVESVYDSSVSTYWIDYAVAWSDYSPMVTIDPFDVADEEGNRLLAEILAVLYSILDQLNDIQGLLDKIAKEIETMFTPSQAAKENLENSMNQLREAMPFDNISQQSNAMKNMFDATVLDAPGSRTTLGESRDWFGIGYSFYLFDFTGLEDIIQLFRNFLSAVVWIHFFFFLVTYIAPKLNI